MEMTAAGWSNQEIAEAVSAQVQGWFDLLAEVAQRAAKRFGLLSPFTAGGTGRPGGPAVPGRRSGDSARPWTTRRLRGARRCARSVNCCGARGVAGARAAAMRARYPDSDGLVVRDGVEIRYERYGEGGPAILLLPPWSLVHSRHWKMQVPVSGAAFHGGVLRRAGQRRLQPACRRERLQRRGVRVGCAGGDGRRRNRQRGPGQRLTRRVVGAAAVRRASGPGAGVGVHRAQRTADAAACRTPESASARRWTTRRRQTYNRRLRKDRATPISSRSLWSASSPSRTRRNRSRTRPDGRWRPMARRWLPTDRGHCTRGPGDGGWPQWTARSVMPGTRMGCAAAPRARRWPVAQAARW